MIGGDPRPERRDRLREVFEFEELEWLETSPRLDEHLASRIRGGSVDFVILLHRFIRHRVSEKLVPICKILNVPWVGVDRGYGVESIRLSIERFLA